MTTLPGIARLRAELAQLEADRDRRTGPTPRLDSLIESKRLALVALERLADQ